MKVARLYTISYSNVQKLNKVKNKSDIVNQAITKFFNEKEKFDMSNIETKSILNAIVSRSDISAQLRAVIEAELWS